MKLALVIPWFGRDLKGGAEQQAWQIAARLAARGHELEVLTTCSRSHQDDWATNHLPPGATVEREGFTVRRFRVEERDRQEFDRVCGALLQLPAEELKAGVPPVPAEDSRIFANELIKSPELLRFLEREKENYDWFLFLPYLYGPVLNGVAIVRERAALQPCLHDEAYAYLPEVAEAFANAGLLLFNSEGEQELAQRLFGPGIWPKSRLVGEGVEVEAGGRNGTGAAASGDPFVLYLGRKDAGKNVPMLVNAFRRFRAVRPNSKLRLLLAGNGSAELRDADAGRAEDLGLVSEERKAELLRDCAALFQPSQNESFSRVIMEAWAHGKPVAAHASCLATAVAVERANGGWLAAEEAEWAELFVTVARQSSRDMAALGENGRRYAENIADWDKVMERYEAAFQKEQPRHAATSARKSGAGRKINQFLPNLGYGDAISNHALWLRNHLRSRGFSSEIHVRFIDPRVAHECHLFSPEALAASDAAIYHHSIGSEITPHLLSYERPKALIYHNITPADFFAPFRPDLVPILQKGRDELTEIAPRFPISCGVSRYNAQELAEHGFANPAVLPIPVSPEKWQLTADATVMEEMQDGSTNLLFVGRLAPNKKQEDLLRAFEVYLELDPGARLILIGKPEENDPYAAFINDLITSLGLEESVVLPGSIAEAQLAAYYRTADLFWSMSEHEGFCVPLIEAMWFDVPVFAYKSSAIPETLGEAALMFTSKEDLATLAATAHLLVQRGKLRRTVIRAQQQRRRDFLPEKVVQLMDRLTDELIKLEVTKKWPFHSCDGIQRAATLLFQFWPRDNLPAYLYGA
ncbi:MAG: glycosyltransferase, partial [Chthoniobacterales bacterium]|nr:glycosyltransferase [Chthoniobacterales bacterium]